ncbi:MAG: hypothetical protein ING44_07640 [Telmatospirillum sp.]|nr:hypothetical protein [Telmatospirillum sp.]
MSSDPHANGGAVLDALIPGDGNRWPPFSAAVDATNFFENCAPDLRHTLSALCEATEGLEPTDRTPAIAAWEKAAPMAFAELLHAAHRAYYTAPRVLAAVAALADSAPREPSPVFDAELVARVINTNAGRRRL